MIAQQMWQVVSSFSWLICSVIPLFILSHVKYCCYCFSTEILDGLRRESIQEKFLSEECAALQHMNVSAVDCLVLAVLSLGSPCMLGSLNMSGSFTVQMVEVSFGLFQHLFWTTFYKVLGYSNNSTLAERFRMYIILDSHNLSMPVMSSYS